MTQTPPHTLVMQDELDPDPEAEPLPEPDPEPEPVPEPELDPVLVPEPDPVPDVELLPEPLPASAVVVESTPASVDVLPSLPLEAPLVPDDVVAEAEPPVEVFALVVLLDAPCVLVDTGARPEFEVLLHASKTRRQNVATPMRDEIFMGTLPRAALHVHGTAERYNEP